MATVTSDSDQSSEEFHLTEEDESENDSDGSQEDPTFDALQSARSRFSRLSIKKNKPDSCISNETMDDDNEEEVVVPKLNAEDQKSYEAVEKIIQVGQVEKLKVDQCKVYLRKHGLRLTGNKDILIARIREHLDILICGGEQKYPASSFVFNCKGDACTGDVVMFEQNVYEMFNIASRSASGPACGKRVVAGRIVKESYGAAKQQHTFTIEVLWSRGEKPLYPLYPLLIKGRNLYRLQTMRQRWEDELERKRILSEKHARGSLARSNREVRVQDKEMRKKLRENRGLTMQHYTKQKGTNGKPPKPRAEKLTSQPREQQENLKKNHCNPKNQPSEIYHQRQHLRTMSSRSIYQDQHQGEFGKPISSLGSDQRRNHDRSRSPLRRPLSNMNNVANTGPLSQPGGYYLGQNHNQGQFVKPVSSLGLEQKRNNEQSRFPPNRPLGNMEAKVPYLLQHHANPLNQPNGYYPLRNSQQMQGVQPWKSNQIHGQAQRQHCRFYPQGRCYYGDNCKYLHDGGEKRNHGEQNAITYYGFCYPRLQASDIAEFFRQEDSRRKVGFIGDNPAD